MTSRRNGDQSSSKGKSSPIFSKKERASLPKILGVDLTDTASILDIDKLQNINADHGIDDGKNETTKRRVSTSPCMIPSASKSLRLNLHETRSLPCEDIKHFHIARPIQTLEVAFSSTDYIPLTKKTGMRDIIEKKMTMINDDVMLSEYKNLIARSVKVIENHGLLHGGESIGQADWIILGEKDVEFQSASKWHYDDLFPEELCRRTRASSRVRSSQIQSLVKDLAGDDVLSFMPMT